MDATKREIRTLDCQLAVREAKEDAARESRTIVGTAIVFNRESQVLDDWGERFREIILPEAVTMAFLNANDIKLNLLHERELTIARCNKGAANSSLRLSVDENGVNFEFDAPRCDLGDRALELVRTGVYSGCSFEFWPKDYEKVVEGDDVTIIHHSFEAISAITIGLDPAYVQTSVNVREVKEECSGKPEEVRACGEDEEKRDEDIENIEEKDVEEPDDEKEDEEEENPNKMERELARRQRNLRRVSNIMRNIFY